MVDTPSPWQNGTPEWNDDRFTVRWMTGYVSEQPSLRTEDRVSKYGYWAWEDRGEQTYPIYDGKPETMVVCAATRKQGDPGDAGYIPEKGRRDGKRSESSSPAPGRSEPVLRWSCRGTNGRPANSRASRSARISSPPWSTATNI